MNSLFETPRYPLTTLATRSDGSLLRAAHVSRMDPVVLYKVCKLRQDVFVLEQGVTSEPELDGTDLASGCVLLWWERDGEVLGTIRVFEGDDVMRIGRLACAKAARRGGFGGDLMRSGVGLCRERAADQAIEIHAQAYLKEWYENLGYVATGPMLVEAGIQHYLMRYTHR